MVFTIPTNARFSLDLLPNDLFRVLFAAEVWEMDWRHLGFEGNLDPRPTVTKSREMSSGRIPELQEI